MCVAADLREVLDGYITVMDIVSAVRQALTPDRVPLMYLSSGSSVICPSVRVGSLEVVSLVVFKLVSLCILL